VEENAGTASRLGEELRDGTLWLTLDNPPANALDNALIWRLEDRLDGVAEEPGVRSVVLTGSGARFFCAGGDIRELETMTAEGGVERVRAFHRLLTLIEALPLPFVCAVNGDAVGGGTETCLFADYRVAVAGARFGLPEINHGLLPASKSIHRAVRVLGLPPARWLLYEGGLIGAEEAAGIGLVDEVVGGIEELHERAAAWAGEMGRKRRRLFAAIKAALGENPHLPGSEVEARSVENFLGYFGDPEIRADMARVLRRKR
jgi:enoyl-CoA hydratase/carnithine racemase